VAWCRPPLAVVPPVLPPPRRGPATIGGHATGSGSRGAARQWSSACGLDPPPVDRQPPLVVCLLLRSCRRSATGSGRHASSRRGPPGPVAGVCSCFRRCWSFHLTSRRLSPSRWCRRKASRRMAWCCLVQCPSCRMRGTAFPSCRQAGVTPKVHLFHVGLCSLVACASPCDGTDGRVLVGSVALTKKAHEWLTFFLRKNGALAARRVASAVLPQQPAIRGHCVADSGKGLNP
jgi:hypothetical protein